MSSQLAAVSSPYFPDFSRNAFNISRKAADLFNALVSRLLLKKFTFPKILHHPFCIPSVGSL